MCIKILNDLHKDSEPKHQQAQVDVKKPRMCLSYLKRWKSAQVTSAVSDYSAPKVIPRLQVHPVSEDAKHSGVQELKCRCEQYRY